MPRPQLTHFLCLPLVTPRSRADIERSMQRFSEAVTATDSEKPQYFTQHERPMTLPGPAIRPPGTLHLTLGVMSLPSPEALAAATKELQSLDISALLHEPLTVSLKGLVPMQTGKLASVLYAEPFVVTGRVEFFTALRQRFEDAGFIQHEERGLKLHATIVNTRYIPARCRVRRQFDPSGLVEAWRDFEWASVKLDRVAICEMGAKDERDSQGRVIWTAYKEVASIPLPQ